MCHTTRQMIQNVQMCLRRCLVLYVYSFTILPNMYTCFIRYQLNNEQSFRLYILSVALRTLCFSSEFYLIHVTALVIQFVFQRVLNLMGNPVVKHIKNYRKTTILKIVRMTILLNVGAGEEPCTNGILLEQNNHSIISICVQSGTQSLWIQCIFIQVENMEKHQFYSMMNSQYMHKNFLTLFFRKIYSIQMIDQYFQRRELVQKPGKQKLILLFDKCVSTMFRTYRFGTLSLCSLYYSVHQRFMCEF